MNQESAPKITALKPAGNAHQRLAIYVQGRLVASLSRKSVDQLRLTVGQAWTSSLHDQVLHARALERAMRHAMGWINRRALSTQQVRDRLQQRGYAEPIVTEALDRLIRIGALDDLALGRTLIEHILARKPAGQQLLRSKLERLQLDPAVIDQLLDEQSAPPDDQVQQAVDCAMQRLRTLNQLPPPVQLRRLWGLLARRGFEADVIESALQRIGQLQFDPDLPPAADD